MIWFTMREYLNANCVAVSVEGAGTGGGGSGGAIPNTVLGSPGPLTTKPLSLSGRFRLRRCGKRDERGGLGGRGERGELTSSASAIL